MASEPTDPNEVEALQRQIAELQAKLTAARQAAVEVAGDNFAAIDAGTQIDTHGGAVIEGSVRVRNGHFIGRDFVQYVTQILQGDEDPEEAKSVIALYLHALATDLAGLKLGEIDSSVDQTRREPLQLADIYVPLDTTLQIPKDTTLAQWLARDRTRKPEDPHEQRETRPVSTREALAAHRELTLLGKPGSGKSTFGASVLLALAQAWQGHHDQLATLGETWTHGALLPIRVVLRRFAEQLAPGDKPARAGDLWGFIARSLDESGYGLSTETMRYVQRIARNHGALVLLDGLDECGEEQRRQRVLGAVRELMTNAGPKCRFILTARPYAWPGGPEPEQGIYALADLGDDQIEQFIHAWHAALLRRGWLTDPGDARRKRDDLLQARYRTDLLPLCKNPLLLTLMASLHTNRGRLPDDRADLYNDSVNLLMLRWNEHSAADTALLARLAVPGLKLRGLREALEVLAFKVHEENVGREGTADISQGRLMGSFLPMLNGSWDKAALVVDYIEKRAGLLIGQGEKHGEPQFTFPHRTFQEFLAACHLARQGNLNEEGVRLAHQHLEHWQEVLVLAARQAESDRGASLADAMIGSEAFDATKSCTAGSDFARAVVAADQLLEIGLANLASNPQRDNIRKRVATWLAGGLQAFEQVPEPTGRAYIGDRLAALGDPRFDRERFFLPADDRLGFVKIAADPDFRIGTRTTDAKRVADIIGGDVPDNELNDTPTPTPEFYIARYPVTVAQFRAFVEDAPFEVGDADALRDPDGRPVRYVNWHEALAYCKWLHEKLGTSPALDANPIAGLVRAHGWRATLPSELEWEKAARGGLSDAVFSWGDEPDPNRANYDDTGIGDTSAVGCFPANGSGLVDMIGNVFEWTRSRFAPYPYRAADGREPDQPDADDWMVLRGGSWHDLRDLARCAFRLRLPPVFRNLIIGFRVVLRSPPAV